MQIVPQVLLSFFQHVKVELIPPTLFPFFILIRAAFTSSYVIVSFNSVKPCSHFDHDDDDHVDDDYDIYSILAQA